MSLLILVYAQKFKEEGTRDGDWLLWSIFTLMKEAFLVQPIFITIGVWFTRFDGAGGVLSWVFSH
eukprot:NODE_2572_length_342_cov_84.358140_g2562_i0.p1 GENE.NODE_2572_length_342_cov_84.358140_g2562_i0~~NODE_2572_length_342_cov_84.358140_g2562_i0.p1  ORF type:complete len:75 (+),score=24.22 NODE_2572_length_342_cov_84.358140_g2562_i0:31-225(+)